MLRSGDLTYNNFQYLRESVDFRVFMLCSNYLRAFNLATNIDFLYLLRVRIRLFLFVYDLFLRKASLFRKYMISYAMTISMSSRIL